MVNSSGHRLVPIERALRELSQFKPRGSRERALHHRATETLQDLILGSVQRRRRPLSPYLTPREVARLFKVTPVTVRGWAASGGLKQIRTPGGHRRFTLAAVEQFKREHRISS